MSIIFLFCFVLDNKLSLSLQKQKSEVQKHVAVVYFNVIRQHIKGLYSLPLLIRMAENEARFLSVPDAYVWTWT